MARLHPRVPVHYSSHELEHGGLSDSVLTGAAAPNSRCDDVHLGVRSSSARAARVLPTLAASKAMHSRRSPGKSIVGVDVRAADAKQGYAGDSAALQRTSSTDARLLQGVLQDFFRGIAAERGLGCRAVLPVLEVGGVGLVANHLMQLVFVPVTFAGTLEDPDCRVPYLVCAFAC